MPYEIRVTKRKKLVLVRHAGDVDCREISQSAKEFHELSSPEDPSCLLIDVRGAASFPTEQEIFDWFQEWPQPGPVVQKLAFVTSEQHARTIDSLAKEHVNRGLSVRVFSREMEALEWLMRAPACSPSKINGSTVRKVATVRIFVSEGHRAHQFYSDLLGLSLSPICDDSGSLQFRLDNADLVIEPLDHNDDRFSQLVGRYTGVSFDVDDIDEAFMHLSALGVRFDGQPAAQSGARRRVDFEDQDGNTLTLVGRPR